jgi:hypothetical protein
MTSITRSVADAPIWNPTLPPSMRTAAGAPQFACVSLRQTANPRPYFPPTTKPTFFTPGTITTQYADFNRSSGMLWSGVAMISLRTVADSANRSEAVSAHADATVLARLIVSATAETEIKRVMRERENISTLLWCDIGNTTGPEGPPCTA